MRKIHIIILIFFILVSVKFIYPQQIQSTSEKSLLNIKSEIKNLPNGKTYLSKSEIQDEFEKKSVGLAIIYSLVLPGMGELYAGDYSSGKYFTIADGTLWLVYIGVDTYGNWQKDRYLSFARSNGDVNTDGKNADYFATISQYTDIDEYNNQKALERDFSSMYNEQQYYWKWTSDDRKAYRSMWKSSEQSYNNLRFVVGGLILNRVISAINAVRLVSAYNKRGSTETSWNLSAGVLTQANLPSGISLNFQTNF